MYELPNFITSKLKVLKRDVFGESCGSCIHTFIHALYFIFTFLHTHYILHRYSIFTNSLISLIDIRLKDFKTKTINNIRTGYILKTSDIDVNI